MHSLGFGSSTGSSGFTQGGQLQSARGPVSGRFSLFHPWNNYIATRPLALRGWRPELRAREVERRDPAIWLAQRLGPPCRHFPGEPHKPPPPGWDHSRRATQPGLLADQKMLLPVGGGPISAVTEAPRLDYLSRSSRPTIGRGYGAGPAAVKGGSPGLVIASTTTIQH